MAKSNVKKSCGIIRRIKQRKGEQLRDKLRDNHRYSNVSPFFPPLTIPSINPKEILTKVSTKKVP